MPPRAAHNILMNFGFKSEKKRKALIKALAIPPSQVIKPQAPINYFPLKQNKKEYSLKSVFPRGTYFIDYMFEKDFIYLLCIGANSRYCYAVVTNTERDRDGAFVTSNVGRNFETFKKAMDEIIVKSGQVDRV
jgi:hypothetical protein